MIAPLGLTHTFVYLLWAIVMSSDPPSLMLGLIDLHRSRYSDAEGEGESHIYCPEHPTTPGRCVFSSISRHFIGIFRSISRAE